jgi:hypothetical protein
MILTTTSGALSYNAWNVNPTKLNSGQSIQGDLSRFLALAKVNFRVATILPKPGRLAHPLGAEYLLLREVTPGASVRFTFQLGRRTLSAARQDFAF